MSANDPSDWRNYISTVGAGMVHSFETGLYTDVSFKVGPTAITVNAHTAIMMIRSEVFARMFSERWTPTDPDEDRRVVFLPELDPDTFKIFVKYLYTDVLPTDLNVEGGLELLDMAHLYQVPPLILKCSNVVHSKIDIKTCVEIYQRTQLYTDLALSESALDYMNMNIASLALTDQFLLLDVTMLTNLLKNDEILIGELLLFKALLRWGNVEGTVKDKDGNDKDRKEVMQSLIPLIRFLLIDSRHFSKEVVPTKVLSETEALEIICSKLNGDSKKNERMRKWSKPRQVQEEPAARQTCRRGNVQTLKCNVCAHNHTFVLQS